MKTNIKNIRIENKGTRGAFHDIVTGMTFDFSDIIKYTENEGTEDKVAAIVRDYIEDFIVDTPPTEISYFRVERKGEAIECHVCNGTGVDDEYGHDEDGEYYEYETECANCEGSGHIEVFTNSDWNKLGKLREALGNNSYQGIAHYSDINIETNKWETTIFAIGDCSCPCSDITIATIEWNKDIPEIRDWDITVEFENRDGTTGIETRTMQHRFKPGDKVKNYDSYEYIILELFGDVYRSEEFAGMKIVEVKEKDKN